MRFADAIFTRFGIRYDPDHVGRIMHRLGLRERKQNRRPRGVLTMPAPIEVLPEATSSVA
jgi:transposase